MKKIISKIRSNFTIKKITATLIASIISITSYLGMKTLNKNHLINSIIDNTKTYNDAINDISENYKVDEILETPKFYEFNKNKDSVDKILSLYENNRKEEKMYELNENIKDLGLITLKSSIINSLKKDVKDITELKIISNNECTIEYNIEIEKIVSGGIIDTDIIKIKDNYLLKGKAAKICEIIYYSQSHAYHNEYEIDTAYKEIIKFLYTKPENSNRKILNRDKINFEYDMDLIKKLKK